MAEKNLNARIVHKHDSEANWNKAVNFIPKQGEIIIYDIDATHTYERIKIGDGTTKVTALPFSQDYHTGDTNNPHNVTASQVGLSNVGNFKAVSTVANQSLTSTEKSNARANIGAGTSSLTIGTTSTTAAAGNHTHSASDVGAAASSHTHKSSDVTLMTGYLKAASASAIAATDTLNAAIGKLEKALDGKQASGSYSASGHTHDDRYYTETEIDTKFTNMVGDTSVSSQISNATSNYLPLAGGTMTGTTILPENKLAQHYRNQASYHSGVMYQTSGNEALVFANKNEVTSHMFLTGTDPTTMTSNTFQNVTPAMQIKKNSVYINKRIDNNVDPTHKLYVNGNSRVDGDINISGSVDLKYDSTKKCLSFVFG